MTDLQFAFLTQARNELRDLESPNDI